MRVGCLMGWGEIPHVDSEWGGDRPRTRVELSLLAADQLAGAVDRMLAASSSPDLEVADALTQYRLRRNSG